MLDAIADFWKPVKRLHSQVRLKPEELQMGSVVGFGAVPQPSLSNRKLTVSGINTYKFGPDILTSFVLSQDKDAGASMIVAETGGEQYIAISRRISISDRNKLFAHEDIEAAMKSPDAVDLNVRDIPGEYRGWVMPHYKREQHHNVKGQLYKGDHRSGLISGEAALNFSYTLLVSDNHEHALEIERYDDGRVEVYATVYRRMSDVNDVTHPNKEVSRPDVKLVSNGTTPSFTANSKPEPKLGATVPPAAVPEKKVALETKPAETKPEVKHVEAPALESKPVAQPIAWKTAEQKAETKVEAKPEPKVELKKEPEVLAAEKKAAEVQTHAVTTPVKLPEFSADNVARKETSLAVSSTAEPLVQNAVRIQSNTQPYTKQEIKAVNKETSNFVNESIDCELQVANKIIDEAIRNEMRINDVVRRVIGLPVSQQESVQIPVTLTEQDYALLAIRYGISGSDHEAIKRRITEDLADFSGANKQKKAA